jgi:hypothetical protein
MGEVLCRKCGEEYNEYYISHILPEKDRTAFRIGLYCPKCQTREEPSEHDTKLMLESIVEIIQELRDKFISLALKFTPGAGNKRQLLPESVYTLLEDYFISCQIAEGRIKEAWKNGIINYEEVQGLYKEIGGDVTTIIFISKLTPPLNDKMIQLTETQPFVIRLLKIFTRPDVYEAFVYLKRKYRAMAEPSEDRTAENKWR